MTYAFDTGLALYMIWSLRMPRTFRGPIAWPFVVFLLAIWFSGDVFHYRGEHRTEQGFGFATTIAWILITFFGGRGTGRKLWGKIMGSGLTSINADSFKRQVSEAA